MDVSADVLHGDGPGVELGVARGVAARGAGKKAGLLPVFHDGGGGKGGVELGELGLLDGAGVVAWVWEKSENRVRG